MSMFQLQWLDLNPAYAFNTLPMTVHVQRYQMMAQVVGFLISILLNWTEFLVLSWPYLGHRPHFSGLSLSLCLSLSVPQINN